MLKKYEDLALAQ